MRPYENLSLEDMPGEVWKDIPGWEGYYQASNMGRIKSKRNNMIRKQHPHHDDYLLITLVRGTTFKSGSVHRIIANTFIENPEKKPVIDHINCDRKDNRAANLRWTTIKENNNNPITARRKLGRQSPMKGRTDASCPLCKPIFSVSEDGRIDYYWGVMDAKRTNNLDPYLIKKSLMNPRKKAYRKHWYYL